MKRRKFTEPESAKLRAMVKITYQKQGIEITIGGLTGIDGFAFETEVKGKLCKGIITNERLRRAQRRKAIKLLTRTLEIGYLGEFPDLVRDTRGAILHSAEGLK